MLQINEGSTAYLRCEFKDSDGVQAFPTAVECRIDCITSGAAIRALAPVTPASSVTTIEISATENAIQDDANRRERRRVTVIAEYGTPTDQSVSQYDYAVVNLTGLE